MYCGSTLDTSGLSQPSMNLATKACHRDMPIHETSDDHDVEMTDDDSQASVESRVRDLPNHLNEISIELASSTDGNEDDCEKDWPRFISTAIDVAGEQSRSREQNLVTAPLPTPITLPEPETLVEFKYCNGVLRNGVTVEIPAVAALYQASFLYIKSIMHQPLRGVFIKGLPLTRTRNLRGRLPRLRNELCLLLQVSNDDFRAHEDQALIELDVTKVKGIRTLYFTNADFPSKRYPNGVHTTVADIEQRGILVCRWRCVLAWRTQQAYAKKNPPEEFSIEHLTRKDASRASYRVSDVQRRNIWRGGKTRGGAFLPHQTTDKEFIVNVETTAETAAQSDSEDCWTHCQPEQRYTFADMFCGAGGASCGAEMAGFSVQLSCDNSPHACETYRHRFPHADLREMDIFDFILQERNTSRRVDVMHISPPCQFWSPAHTVPGMNDDANIASLFSCHELVRMLRPRIFTLEQTFGILDPRFEHYFNVLIHGFTQYGYSVRWKVANLIIWGCPSRRNRLIMLGSCPGETLPPFPPPTHSEDPQPGDGMKPFVTVRQALRKITPMTTMRHPLQLCQKPSWDPNVPLQRTITCSGGIGNYHYSGQRYFYWRELASMQGFPVDYEFRSTNVKRQIGNAFPPCVVKTIYRHVKRWLWDKDRVVHSDEDEFSEPDEAFVDDDDDEPEYLGERNLSHGDESSGAAETYDCFKVVDIDWQGPEDQISMPCIDVNQRGRPTTLFIDLTGPIDLTADDPAAA